MTQFTAKCACLLLLILFILNSCSIEKRRYNRGYHVDWFSSKAKKQEKAQNIKTTDFSQQTLQEVLGESGLYASHDSTQQLLASSEINAFNGNMLVQIPFMAKNQLIKSSDSNICDLIILRNGEEISAKVTEVGEEIIKYKMCDNLDGPIFTKRASEVFMIKYPNGTKTIISVPEEAATVKLTPQNQTQKPSEIHAAKVDKTIPFSPIFSLLTGIVGLFVFGIIFGLLAIIFGIIGLNKSKSEPDKYGGSGLATWGIVLGSIDILAVLIILALL